MISTPLEPDNLMCRKGKAKELKGELSPRPWHPEAILIRDGLVGGNPLG